ncbi:hypothetical protein [Aquibacillus sediminis]|nr:hypothetical protein [Aquibacillus sediminis]
MERKPMHYDGSGKIVSVKLTETKPFEITDEMRRNISGNPYILK